MRSKMTLRRKTDRSSAFRNYRGSRHYDTGSIETQEHLELCSGFNLEQRGLKIDTNPGKLINCKWRQPKRIKEKNLKKKKKKKSDNDTNLVR